MLLSAVIPVFNEEESLPALQAELVEVATANSYDLEIIFIDAEGAASAIATSTMSAAPPMRTDQFCHISSGSSDRETRRRDRSAG